jgi:hypothetical protein
MLVASQPPAFAEPPLAEEPGASVPPPTCGGTDMLQELAVTDPDTYARIKREGDSVENGNALLWKVEKNGAAPSYVFGTVHLTDPRVTTLSDKVREALGQSKVVALEAADLSPATTANALAEATKAALFTNGRSLENMLTADEYEKVRATLDRAGLPVGTARLYKPWIVSLLISASACERSKIQHGEPVLDMKIAEEAKARGISVTGLETIEDQLAAMASVPDEQQIGMLRAGLKFAERTDDLVETMVRLYLDRRMGATWAFQLALAEKAGVGENSFVFFKQALIVDRNRKMRDAALPLLDNGGVFIAVGALHLPGETGLVELLRERGYTLTPVE